MASLEEDYKSFRINAPGEIPFWVWLMENPDSPLPFPGQVNLKHHDLIHILLGVGVTREEEALVVGWTLGNDPNLRDWHIPLFLWVACTLYPDPYCFRKQDISLFYQGLEWGKRCPYLNKIDTTRSADEVREEYGIPKNKESLRQG